MMGAVEYTAVPSGREGVKRYAAVDNSSKEPVSIGKWMSAVASNSPTGIKAACDLSEIIASSSYASVLFETPGSSWKSSGNVQMEFALVDEPDLQKFAEGNPDRDAFAEHFDTCLRNNKEDMVCSFANLGGDARLVSPLPQTGIEDSAFSHLAAFLRNAPSEQIAEFWRMGASQYLEVLNQNKQYGGGTNTWFSTNGLGVAWLHLRLDSRPKYYSYGPFTRESTSDIPLNISF